MSDDVFYWAKCLHEHGVEQTVEITREEYEEMRRRGGAMMRYEWTLPSVPTPTGGKAEP